MTAGKEVLQGEGGIVLLEEVPRVDEYRALRAAAGLKARSVQAAQRGLPGTLFAVCLRKDDELIGMGRIIGDGGLNFEVVDIAVHPGYQRMGLGSRVMKRLTRWLHDNAPESAYVCLIADDDAPALYKKFGFEFTAPKSVGMALRR